jgi:hypothetical protein
VVQEEEELDQTVATAYFLLLPLLAVVVLAVMTYQTAQVVVQVAVAVVVM